MPSQFFGLNTAYTGLLASNAALNTTSNNISNVETEGYSRQNVKQAAADALRVFTTYGCAGAGVDVLAIERIRDEFYDVKYWNNNSNLGEYDIKKYYMKQIENYFMDEPEKSIEGFNTIFDKVYDMLAEVKKNAGSPETKSQFVGYAKSLTEYFNNMGKNLQELQKDLNMEIKNKVDEINSYAAEIASLNKQINVVELAGSTANELRDQRGVLIDKLSKIVDIEVEEIPVYDVNQPDRDTGANRFQIKIAGGQTLVDTNEYNSLVCTARENSEKGSLNDINGLYDIAWDNGLEVNLYGANLGGELKALIQMRDGNNGEYFQGTTQSIGSKVVDGVNHSTVSIDVSADYLLDLNKNNLSDGGGYIALGNKMYKYDSWSVDYKKAADGTITGSYTFVLADEEGNVPDSTRLGKKAEIGQDVPYQGIPYYMSQMNEWVRSFSQAFNEILTQEGSVDDHGDPATYLFMGDKRTDNDQWRFTEQNWVDNGDGTFTMSVDDSADSYYKLTALNFSINENIVKDAGKFATHTGASEGQDKYDVLEDLVDLKNNRDRMSFRNGSASEFLKCIASDVALNAGTANTFGGNYENIGSNIQNQRLSISGVDKDEEAINLVKYQNAYDLASKMIQTLTEVYDRLILQTGV